MARWREWYGERVRWQRRALAVVGVLAGLVALWLYSDPLAHWVVTRWPALAP